MRYRRAALAAIVVISILIGTSGDPAPVVARPQSPALAVLQRQVSHDQHKIRALQHRRTYLHHFIAHLRATRTNVPAAPAPTPATTTSRAPAPSYSGGVLTDAQVTSYLLAAGFPSSAVSTMLYYSHRESGNDPNAINSSSGACGLFQLYPCSGGSAWLDPATNAREAYAKYSAPVAGGGIAGFAPWGG